MSDAGASRPPRRARTATESLLSIVLVLEAIVIFFVTLTVFGLGQLPPAVAFGGGAALVVILLLATRLLRYSWGVWVGWVLQGVLAALGFIQPAVFIVAALFIAMWIYCVVQGRRIDTRNAQSSDNQERGTP